MLVCLSVVLRRDVACCTVLLLWGVGCWFVCCELCVWLVCLSWVVVITLAWFVLFGFDCGLVCCVLLVCCACCLVCFSCCCSTCDVCCFAVGRLRCGCWLGLL